MPELPEVEQYRRFFRDHATGRTVRSVQADPTIVRNATPRALSSALHDRTLEEPRRHGKWLICPAGGPVLLLHFGMTGDLIWSGDDPDRHRHDRLTLRFRGGEELRYRNMRKLGGVWLAAGEPQAEALLAPLGPDALEVGSAEFLRLLSRRRGAIKAALMDQTFVAGMGNLIVDELLWQARIHPKRRVETLSPSERKHLHVAMRRILRRAVDRFDYLEGERRWLSSARGTPDAHCPRCRTPLARTVVAGRTTWFCPTCQV